MGSQFGGSRIYFTLMTSSRFAANRCLLSLLSVIHRINETLHNIQESIDRKEGADVAYRQFINLMIPEMEEKLEVCKRNQNAQTKRKIRKKMSKPYWNDELNAK